MATGEILKDWRKANVMLVFKKDPENSRPVSLSSIPGKVVEQLILENISRHIWEKKIIRSTLHGFKGKSCLTNFNDFYSEMIGLVNERRQWLLSTWASGPADEWAE